MCVHHCLAGQFCRMLYTLSEGPKGVRPPYPTAVIYLSTHSILSCCPFLSHFLSQLYFPGSPPNRLLYLRNPTLEPEKTPVEVPCNETASGRPACLLLPQPFLLQSLLAQAGLQFSAILPAQPLQGWITGQAGTLAFGGASKETLHEVLSLVLMTEIS